MRYPALNAIIFYFGTDGAGIAVVIGTIGGVLCDVSLVFLFHYCCI